MSHSYYSTNLRFVKVFMRFGAKIVKYMVLPTIIFVQFDGFERDYSAADVLVTAVVVVSEEAVIRLPLSSVTTVVPVVVDLLP